MIIHYSSQKLQPKTLCNMKRNSIMSLLLKLMSASFIYIAHACSIDLLYVLVDLISKQQCPTVDVRGASKFDSSIVSHYDRFFCKNKLWRKNRCLWWIVEGSGPNRGTDLIRYKNLLRIFFLFCLRHDATFVIFRTLYSPFHSEALSSVVQYFFPFKEFFT